MADGRYAWPVSPTDVEIEWIRKTLDSCEKPYHALDPCCAGGSVLYECGIRGWRCTGLEPDPFQRWIAMVRSYRFRDNAGEFSGYAWERVVDNVFWESDMYTVPEVPGTLELKGSVLDYMRRVRRQIDKESDEGINNLLRLAICNVLPDMASVDVFDDTVGMAMIADSLVKIRDNLGQNPELSQTVHLCDPRDIPCPLRSSYDLMVSVLPTINESAEPVLRRTMAQWIGYGDLTRRDDLSMGYPLGDYDDYMSRYVPYEADSIRAMLPETDKFDYLSRWFEDVRDLLISVKNVMSSKCRAHFFVPDEKWMGVDIPKADIISEIASSVGLMCEKEGTGTSRCVVVYKNQ